MTAAGGRRRVWWCAVGVWTVAVVMGGGLTLWLQDSAKPRPPGGWESTQEDDRDIPAPLLSMDASRLPCPSETEGMPVLCAYARTRGE